MPATIADISLVLVAVIAVIVGLVKGFAKQFTGLLSGIVALLLSVLLTAVAAKAITGMEIFATFQQTAAGWFSKEVYTTAVASQEELAELLANGRFVTKLLSSQAPALFNMMTSAGFSTLGQLVGMWVAMAILYFATWSLLFIVLKIVFSLVGKLLDKIAHLPVLKTIDKILGMVWSLLFTYLVVVGVLLTAAEVVTIKFLNAHWEGFCQFLSQTKLILALHNTNILGNFLASLFSVQLPALPL